MTFLKIQVASLVMISYTNGGLEITMSWIFYFFIWLNKLALVMTSLLKIQLVRVSLRFSHKT